MFITETSPYDPVAKDKKRGGGEPYFDIFVEPFFNLVKCDGEVVPKF